MAGKTPGDYERIQSEGQYQVGADIPTITFNEIGKKGIRRIDGYEKVSGQAIYARDVQISGMLYAFLVRQLIAMRYS